MNSFFTRDQWQWLADRYREGYPIQELSAFLGVHRETVRRGLIRQGVRTGPGGLPPLNDRKQEFYGLEGGGTP